MARIWNLAGNRFFTVVIFSARTKMLWQMHMDYFFFGYSKKIKCTNYCCIADESFIGHLVYQNVCHGRKQINDRNDATRCGVYLNQVASKLPVIIGVSMASLKSNTL